MLWDSLVGYPENAAVYSALAKVPVEELVLPGGLLGAMLDRATESFDCENTRTLHYDLIRVSLIACVFSRGDTAEAEALRGGALQGA